MKTCFDDPTRESMVGSTTNDDSYLQQRRLEEDRIKPEPVLSQQDASQEESTAVDGKGMWRSWTRVFAKPESACLDLLDNCFDAALGGQGRGRAEMKSHGTCTISIQNSSTGPIPLLADVLTVYKSDKNADVTKTEIGENGVGLKQGCATLSDCSMVLTRNERTMEIGIIAKRLQTPHGVHLPSFSFNVRQESDVPEILHKWLSKHPTIKATLQESWGTSADVFQQVNQFVQCLWQDPWNQEDHVFLLVLCHLKNAASIQHEDDVEDAVSPAEKFLQDMKAVLPQQYVNLPSNFDFEIDSAPIHFTYWQRRLVELTKFEVYIPTDEPFDSLPEHDWDQPGDNKYKLSIFCGFEAPRVDQNVRTNQGTSTCQLHIYSCCSGRLIKQELDARYMLGLNASGVDFTQGLTVLINDFKGHLPLMPTKDGIAWSEHKHGETHQKNLMAWTGAVARFFWMHHRNRFGSKGGNNSKEKMKKRIQSFAAKMKKLDDSSVTVTENLEAAKFHFFQELKWSRIQANFDNRWTIREIKKSDKRSRGADTLFSFDNPKRRTSANRGPANQRQGSLIKQENGETGEHQQQQQPWPDIDVEDIPRVALGVLAYLRERDTDNIFGEPVLKTMPNITDTYLQAVSKPMDFRTIEEERLPIYTAIAELQDDLILVFQNCIDYNGADSPYSRRAQSMLDKLDDAFDSMDVQKVTMRVLSYMRDLDERDLFEIPVLEQVPQLQEAYLAVISEPMDFRTIELERMDEYKNVSELRQDLELIFDNCIRFNGADSAYGEIAQGMLERLGDAFEDLTTGKKRRKGRKPTRYGATSTNQNNKEDGEEANVAKKRSSKTKKQKKTPYPTLAKQLRETQKLLEAERVTSKELRETIHELQKQVAARDERIQQLETKRTPTERGRSKNPTVTPPTDNKRGTKHRFEDEDSSDDESGKETFLPHLQQQDDSSDEKGCLICGQDDCYDKMILCQLCNENYHSYCLNPPVPAVPDGEWYCPRCSNQGWQEET